MNTNGDSAMQAIAPIIAAYEQTTRSNLSQAQKAEALQFLEQFQKSVCTQTFTSTKPVSLSVLTTSAGPGMDAPLPAAVP
jgi:hypothetical protein